MKYIVFIAMVWGLTGSAHSQVITVTDAETGKPMEAVTLVSQTPRAFAVTNKKGRASIEKFAGSDAVEIRMLGYETVRKSFDELKEADFKIRMKHTGLSMDEFVVAAARGSGTSADVPVKVSKISRKQVALQNPQTAADMLETSGDVFVQKSQQGGGSPMIRGFAANRLLYAVDGVRMNNAIFRSGNLQNVISLDPLAMEDAEVVFGPGSIMYGSDAVGGVMSFQTLTPQFSESDTALITGNAVTRYSSANNEKTAHADINIGLKKWAFVTSATYTDYDDLLMGTRGPDEYLRNEHVRRIDGEDRVVPNDNPRTQIPSGYSQLNLMQKVRFRPNENWDFEYGFHYSETSEFGRYDRLTERRNGQLRAAEWRYGPQKWIMNNLNITHYGNNKLYDRMTVRLAHQLFEESRIDRVFDNPWRRTRVEEVDAYSANADFSKSLSKRNNLHYGVEAVHNVVRSTATRLNINSGEEQAAAPRYPRSNWGSYAVYVTNQFKASEKVTLHAGSRYNQYLLNSQFSDAFYDFPFSQSSINRGAITGSIGFTYQPGENTLITGNASTAFRAPNVDDAGKVFDSEPGAVVIPNPNLSAEYAYNVDLGIVKMLGSHIKLDVTGYYTWLENALVRRDYSVNGRDSIMYDGELSRVQAVQNAAQATVYGVQAGIDITLPANLTLHSKYNYQKGEEEMDNGDLSPSRHTAPWFGVTRLTYSIHKLDLQAYAMYSGEVPFENMPVTEIPKTYMYATNPNGNPYSPGWYTLNFKAMYQAGNHLTVSAGVENITNQRYRPFASGIVAPGRNFIASLRGSF